MSSEGAREFGEWLTPFSGSFVPDQVAVDLGCGTGEDALVLLKHGMRVLGIDRDFQRVTEARRRAPEALFCVADLRSGAPVRDASVNVALASLSLHYFPLHVTHEIVRDIRRVLKPGGSLICRVNAVGDELSGYGQGRLVEPDLFEVEPGVLKRFFSMGSLHDLLATYLQATELWPEATQVRGRYIKQTIVARAVRGV